MGAELSKIEDTIQTANSVPQKHLTNDANLQKPEQPKSSDSQQSTEHQQSSNHHTTYVNLAKQDDHIEIMKKLKEKIVHLKSGVRKSKKTNYFKYCENLSDIAYTYYETDLKFEDYRFEISRELVTSGSVTILCDNIVDIYSLGQRADDLCDVDLLIFTTSLTILKFMSKADQKDTPVICNHPTFLESSAQYLKQIKENIDSTFKERSTAYSILSIIHNVAMFDDNVSRLRSFNYVDVLTPYLDSLYKDERLIAIAYMADVVIEEESEVLAKGQNALSFLMELLAYAVQLKDRSYFGFSVWELTRILRKIAKNDSNKKAIVDLFLPLLVEIAKSKEFREQREATGTLWTLSFGTVSDKYIQNKMSSDTGIIEVLLSGQKSPDKDVAKASKGALWSLREELIRNEKYKDLDIVNLEIQQAKGHVMISYQWSNQKIMIKVRDYLRNNGFKVWMDIDDMAGSTLEAMARAVEDAEVILMCFSKKYKDSDNCRAEAEYAFQKRKKIIPLKMEQNYKADGWLGIIIGADLYYDFSGKRPFEPTTKKLITDLKGRFSNSKEKVTQSVKDVAHPAIAVSPTSEVKSTVCQGVAVWTSEQVKQWLDKHGLDRSKFRKLKGVEIDYLQFLLERSPDSYTKALADRLMITDLLTEAKFTFALRNTTI